MNVNKEGYYKYLVLIACFTMCFVPLGFCSSVKSLFLAAITKDLEIPRSLFTLNDSFRYITVAFVSVFFGKLLRKFGARNMIACGIMILLASQFVYSIASTMPVFYLGGILLGAGLSCTTTAMAGYLINKYFDKNTNTLTGIALAANALGGSLASQILSPIIYDGPSDGWRTAYRFVMLVLFITGLVIVALLWKHKPAMDADANPKKKHAVAAAEASDDGIDEPPTPKRFLIMALGCGLLTNFCITSVIGNASAHLYGLGFDSATVASILSIHLIALAVAKVTSGFMFDKLGMRFTMLYSDSFIIIGILCLVFAKNTFMILMYSVLLSLGEPLETVLISSVTRGLFNKKEFPVVLGYLTAAHNIGSCIGLPLSNIYYDATGSYIGMFAIVAAIMCVVTICMQYMVTASNKRKKEAKAA